jgi:hypothetical protein
VLLSICAAKCNELADPAQSWPHQQHSGITLDMLFISLSNSAVVIALPGFPCNDYNAVIEDATLELLPVSCM